MSPVEKAGQVTPVLAGSRTKGHTDKKPPDKRPQLPIYASISLLINVI